MAMTVIVMLCTAWAAPQALTTGDSMKMMQLNWKRSLATLALLAAFNGPEATDAVAQSDKPAPPPAPAPEVAPAKPALPADPSASSEATEAPAAPKPPSPPAAAVTDTNVEQAREDFRARYGLAGPQGSAVPPGRPRQARRPARGSKIEAKLKQIVLPEITFDGLPLGEVLKILSDEAIKRDPDKTGVNFLINPNVRPVARAGAVDPATGLPPATPAEQWDVASVSVKFNLPLRNVTMKDVLDAIVIVADHPLKYTLEDYAVVFSAKPDTVAGAPVVLTRPDWVPEPPQPLSPTPDPFRPKTNLLPMLPEEPSPPGSKLDPSNTERPAAEQADVKPQAFNIDFGPGSPSEQVGPAGLWR
jgi:hypothetical protein